MTDFYNSEVISLSEYEKKISFSSHPRGLRTDVVRTHVGSVVSADARIDAIAAGDFENALGPKRRKQVIEVLARVYRLGRWMAVSGLVVFAEQFDPGGCLQAVVPLEVRYFVGQTTVNGGLGRTMGFRGVARVVARTVRDLSDEQGDWVTSNPGLFGFGQATMPEKNRKKGAFYFLVKRWNATISLTVEK